MRLCVNGVGYNVECAGQGEPLLLLHGFTGSAATWKHMARLGENYFTIALDLLGHGKSDAPADAARYSMANLADDLREIIGQLNVEQVNLLGYSMGGRAALYFAHRHPEWVRRLILESASPGLAEASVRALRAQSDAALAESIERDGVETFVEYWQNIPLFATQKDLPETVRAEFRAVRLQNSAQGLANSLRGLSVGLQPSLWDDLGTIRMPTLLVTGELDTKFTNIGQAMAQAIPNAKLRIVRGAGHTVHLEEPEAFERLVLNFLKESGN